MLPATAYTDPAVLAWEREHLFDAGWVAVAPASALRESGLAGRGVGRPRQRARRP